MHRDPARKQRKNRRMEERMIHLARPTISLVVNIVFAWYLFCFARFWKVGTDGQHVRKQWSLSAVTVGRPSGSIEGEWWREWKSAFYPQMIHCEFQTWVTDFLTTSLYFSSFIHYFAVEGCISGYWLTREP